MFQTNVSGILKLYGLRMNLQTLVCVRTTHQIQ